MSTTKINPEPLNTFFTWVALNTKGLQTTDINFKINTNNNIYIP